MGVDNKGTASNSHVYMSFGGEAEDRGLIRYRVLPITDNNSSACTNYNTLGHLPSDIFTGATSFVDPKAKYSKTDNLIPSPYLGDEPNPEYYKTLEYGNVLSDFNGLGNTQTLVRLSSNYTAANAAWKYNDESSNLQWHLPSAGEIGYLISRLKLINNSIATLGGVTLQYNSTSQ